MNKSDKEVVDQVLSDLGYLVFPYIKPLLVKEEGKKNTPEQAFEKLEHLNKYGS